MSDPTSAGRVEQLRGPMAFLADIHGNLKALDAVLDELRDLRAGALYVAGDLLLGGDDPAGVWRRLQEANARCVRGPSDLALATVDPGRLRADDEAKREALRRFRLAREAVGELTLAKLKRLPEALRIELPGQIELLVVHGSPRDAAEPFSFDMSDAEMEALVGDDTADLVLCGGGHVPFERALDAVRVVCVGSVGEAPEGGVAHYVLVTPTPEGPRVDPRWVRYA